MKASWKDFVSEKRAQLLPGQGYNGLKGTVASPLEYDIRTDPKYARAYSFYRDIAPAIRMRELGVDKLPENERKAFEEVSRIPVEFSSKPPKEDPKAVGWYSQSTPPRYSSGDFLSKIDVLGHLLGFYRNGPEKIHLVRGTDARDLVHEMRHALARRLNLGNNELIDKTYGFKGVNIRGTGDNKADIDYSRRWGDEEQYTTNKEHQFDIYNTLYKELGRAPTPEEYFKASAEERRINQTFSTPTNGYEYYANLARSPNGSGIYFPRFYGTDKEREIGDMLSRENVPFRFVMGPGDAIPSWARMLDNDTQERMRQMSTGKETGLFHISPRSEILHAARWRNFVESLEEMQKLRIKAMQDVTGVSRPAAHRTLPNKT